MVAGLVHCSNQVLEAHLASSMLKRRVAETSSCDGRCTPYVGRPGSRFNACLADLLRMRSMKCRWALVKIPMIVAWYLDLRNWSITNFGMPGEMLLGLAQFSERMR